MHASRFRSYALLLCLLAACLPAPRALAETPGAPAAPSKEYALTLDVAPLDPELQQVTKKARQRRLMIAIGAGTVVGSLVSLALLGLRPGCDSEEQTSMSLVGTGLVGGIGLSLVIGGGVGLGQLPSRHRTTLPGAGPMIPLALDAALGGFLHAFAIGAPQAVCPISS